jgi:hypothetical protein
LAARARTGLAAIWPDVLELGVSIDGSKGNNLLIFKLVNLWNGQYWDSRLSHGRDGESEATLFIGALAWATMENSRPAPLIDGVHHLKHLWRSGDLVRLDEYLDASRWVCA